MVTTLPEMMTRLRRSRLAFTTLPDSVTMVHIRARGQGGQLVDILMTRNSAKAWAK